MPVLHKRSILRHKNHLPTLPPPSSYSPFSIPFLNNWGNIHRQSWSLGWKAVAEFIDPVRKLKPALKKKSGVKWGYDSLPQLNPPPLKAGFNSRTGSMNSATGLRSRLWDKVGCNQLQHMVPYPTFLYEYSLWWSVLNLVSWAMYGVSMAPALASPEQLPTPTLLSTVGYTWKMVVQKPRINFLIINKERRQREEAQMSILL